MCFSSSRRKIVHYPYILVQNAHERKEIYLRNTPKINQMLPTVFC